MIFINCVFENVIFLLLLRIYDIIKLIMMTCFLLIAYLKMTYFYYFCLFVIIMMTYFLSIAYLKMTYLCIFYYIIFINPTIKFITIISPFNKVLIFIFPNNFLYDIYLRSIFTFL